MADVGGAGEDGDQSSPPPLRGGATTGDNQQPPPPPPAAARMEIGWPTDVRHVAHVTFDRFHGFQGLPDELQPEVHGKAPSASKTVFGVSTESMQHATDSRGNSVPSILLAMQRRLYSQNGLAAEGVFRVAADGAQEQRLRARLNAGEVPDGADPHCLAGLIKAWFRELPGGGLLDAIPPEEVARCGSEEDCARLCAPGRYLAPHRAALLDWAVHLMADVARREPENKMSSRNVAMVFAPNMTQTVDPLTALKYAVQVMNFLNMLIERALKEQPSDHDQKRQKQPSSSSQAAAAAAAGSGSVPRQQAGPRTN